MTYTDKISELITNLIADDNITKDDKEDTLCTIADRCEELIDQMNAQKH